MDIFRDHTHLYPKHQPSDLHAFPNIAAARDEKVSPGGGISDPMAGGWVKQNNQCQTCLVGSFNSSENMKVSWEYYFQYMEK